MGGGKHSLNETRADGEPDSEMETWRIVGTGEPPGRRRRTLFNIKSTGPNDKADWYPPDVTQNKIPAVLDAEGGTRAGKKMGCLVPVAN